MGFRLECGRLVSSSVESVYLVGEPFQHVLETVSDDSIPQALVMLGILTEQLVPVHDDLDEHVCIITENINQTPTATISVETVRRVMWLLSRVRGSLDEERKEIIGKLIREANLNSPGIADTSTEQSQPEKTRLTKKPRGDATIDSCSTPDVSSDDALDGDSTSTSNGDSDDTSVIDTDDAPDQNTVNEANENNTTSKTKYDTTSDTGRIFECEFCTETFEDRDNLTSHSIQCKERPKNARFQCQYCTNEYVSEMTLRRHLKTCKKKIRAAKSGNSATSNHRCSECEKVFDSAQQLIEHKRSHLGRGSRSHSSSESGTPLVQRNVAGAVVHFNAEDGYGFIKTYDIPQDSKSDSDGAQDLFFHVSEYPSTEAKEGEYVQFNIRKTNKGNKAINISFVDKKEIESWDDTFASLRPRWGKDS